MKAMKRVTVSYSRRRKQEECQDKYLHFLSRKIQGLNGLNFSEEGNGDYFLYRREPEL